MQTNQQNIQRYEEDEIDLRELFRTLMKNKIKIVVITAVITIGAIIYTMLKNPTPVYSGEVMIEIGVGVSKNSIEVFFDKSINLKSIIEKEFNFKVDIPKRTSNILLITVNNSDKTKIEKSLKEVVNYVLQKHSDKLKLYDKYIMTKQIGEINVGNAPINTLKKKLIIVVAFVTGLILSIFLVFFMEFIRGFKEEEKEAC